MKKSVDKNEAKPGETVKYTYTVTNTGNSDLQVTLSDVFSKDGVKLDEQLVLKDAEGKIYKGEAFTLAYEGVRHLQRNLLFLRIRKWIRNSTT